ncbi:hypothetical protein [Clostridium magnum]|uniref:Uncharacterized protein n=1 Tax=Clostridium magnum DSM 2767 TaxID=1121326 RepID=A0A161YKZ4_9CLOT|nr:hypothetical protein [Clostridium magnum]KZL91222.1 hypothetical protein CLMAG_29800 [Clostridium magnum DSM 2767]SHI33335.1 hypothetical protein SAMN02745944_04137 [Clostridium magnum DSM 2767]
MDEYNLYVKINYKTLDNREKVAVGGTKVNNGKISSSRYLIGGGVYNRNGGSVIFTAKNLEEIKQITVNKRDMSMNYNVAVIPKGI